MRLINARRRRRHAFTLVELLVVIGIIALLISILLPTLSKARQTAQKSVCLSNLRQLGIAFRLYAVANKDAIPIGYMGQKQFSYVINWNNSNGTKVSQMGLLVLGGMLKSPKAYYCPSEPDPQWQYNTPENVWPFDKTPPDPRLTQAGLGHTRMGYGARPIADWPTNNAGTPIGNTASPGYWLPVIQAMTSTPGTKYTQSQSAVIGLPRFARLKNKAIVADLVFHPQIVVTRHKTGVNCLYANGSAQWVDIQTLKKKGIWDVGTWRDMPPDPGWAFPASNNVLMLDENRKVTSAVSGPSGIWLVLDDASGSQYR